MRRWPGPRRPRQWRTGTARQTLAAWCAPKPKGGRRGFTEGKGIPCCAVNRARLFLDCVGCERERWCGPAVPLATNTRTAFLRALTRRH
jgi:hypothetical protein